MLRCSGQKAPRQVICGRRFESQTILELERTQQATLQMRKLRLSGCPRPHSYLSERQGFTRLVCLEGGKHRVAYQGKICQHLAAGLLTDDLSLFLRNETEVKRPIRKVHTVCLSLSGNQVPPWLAKRAWQEVVDGMRAAEMIRQAPSLTSKTCSLRLYQSPD